MRVRVSALAAIVLPLFAGPLHANEFTIAPNVSGGFGNYAWNVTIDGGPVSPNPPLYLARGRPYTFAITATAVHPFWIKTVQSTGSLNGYAGGGLSANPTSTSAMVTFDVPDSAPDALYYNCGNHPEMTGPIHVVVFRNGFD